MAVFNKIIMKKLILVLYILLTYSELLHAQQQEDTSITCYIKYKLYYTTPYAETNPNIINYVLVNNTNRFASYIINQHPDVDASVNAIMEYGNIDKNDEKRKRTLLFSLKVFNKNNKTPTSYTYIDTEHDTVLVRHHYKYLNDSIVRIKAVPDKLKIELLDDSAKILGYTCKKARVFQGATDILTMWYTEALPYNAGPMYYYGLPGLILKTHFEGSDEYNEAIEINCKNTDALYFKSIKKPTEGVLATLQGNRNLVNKNSEKKRAAENAMRYYNFKVDDE